MEEVWLWLCSMSASLSLPHPLDTPCLMAVVKKDGPEMEGMLLLVVFGACARAHASTNAASGEAAGNPKTALDRFQ